MLTAAPQTIAGRVGNAMSWSDAIAPDYDPDLIGGDFVVHRTAFEIEYGIDPVVSFDQIAAHLNCSRQLVCKLYGQAVRKIMKQGRKRR